MGTKKTTWPSRSGRASRVGRGVLRGSKELRPPEVRSKTGNGNICQSPVEPVIRPSTTVQCARDDTRHAATPGNRGVSGEVVKENAQGVVTVAMIGHSIRPSWMGLERHHGPDTMSRFFLADPSGPVSQGETGCRCLVASHHVARSWEVRDSMDSVSRTRRKMKCARKRSSFPSTRKEGEEGGSGRRTWQLGIPSTPPRNFLPAQRIPHSLPQPGLFFSAPAPPSSFVQPCSVVV